MRSQRATSGTGSRQKSSFNLLKAQFSTGIAIFVLFEVPMKTVTQKTVLHKAVGKARQEGKGIGLVPTMGALHEGHLSLIRAAMKNNDFIIVTLFVNPTQFNNLNDLECYPRDMDADLKLLKEYPLDLVFAPSVEEMYPEKDNRVFDLSPLDRILEGEYRPGHFNGVAQIVSKLFEAASPDTAYFGQKDFQQLAVIKKLVSLLHLDIKIIGCPIIREEDGLAMSSRNRLLTPTERAAAPLIYQSLLKAKQMKNRHTPDEIKAFVKSAINNHPMMQVEYFEIVDDQNLMQVKSWQEPVKKVGCVAVQLGGVRLIDNIYFS